MQVFTGKGKQHWIARCTQKGNKVKNIAWYVLSRCAWRPKTALARRSRDRCHTGCTECCEVFAACMQLPEKDRTCHAKISRSHASYNSVEEAHAAAVLYRYDRTVWRDTPGTPALHVGFKHASTSAEFLAAFNRWKTRDEPVLNICDVCDEPAYIEDGEEAAEASMCAWPRVEDERQGYHVACRKRVCAGCAATQHPHCDGNRGRHCRAHCAPDNHRSEDGTDVIRTSIGGALP